MEQGSGGLLGAVAKEQGWHRRRKQFEVTHYWQLAFLWAHTMLWVPKEIPCLSIIIVESVLCGGQNAECWGEIQLELEL